MGQLITRAGDRLRWLQAALLILAGWFVFSPSFRGDWLWDDFEIRENPSLRDWSGLNKIWFASDSPDYYPLKTSALWVQWHLWHENLLGYHLANVGLHLLGAFLLWHVLKKLGVRLAWLGGLLFVIHPLAVGSVAWVSEIKNTLSFPLLLLAMVLFIVYDDELKIGKSGNRKIGKYYWSALLLFLAAMLCKSSVVMFPFVLLLYCWWKRGRISRADVRHSLPFFAVSLVLGLVTVWFQKFRAIANWRLPHESFASQLAGAGLAIKFYFLKCIFPGNLMPIYPGWPAGSHPLSRVIPWLVLAAVAGWLWTKRSGFGRHALFGLGFFTLNLVPVLGFVPMAFLHLAPVADHLAYLSVAGLIGLAAAGVGAAWDRLAQRPRAALAAAVAAICALLALQSRGYARIFLNQETMWAYNLRLNDRSPGVYVNLAFIEHHDGHLDEAIANYKKAILLDPEDPEPEDELANVLIDQNDFAEAAPHYEKAIAHYERALQLDPSLFGTRRSLAKLLAKAGRTEAAIGQYETFLKQHPDDPEIENDLGKALTDAGRPSEAMSHYKKALGLAPHYAEAENSLGFAIATGGRPGEGIVHLTRALEIDPNFAEAHNNLGFVLAGMGRQPEAILQFQEALRLKPGLAQAHNNLGFALAASGRRREAIAQFEEALRLNPKDAKARYNLNRLKIEEIAAGADR